ncbi:MAG TPA: BlaI/MecI/CopY family transcriptional regulator [Planctomycetota bacterium]|nr:BlaI/MecI/CopY family transcriptional regulator [Planctomycetota bacterium]
MSPSEIARCSGRERQMLDVVYRLGSARAREVLGGIPDPPSYSAVRATLQIMVAKGLLRKRREGRNDVYTPARTPLQASRAALKQLVRTFFGGSAVDAAAALFDASDAKLSDADHARLRALIDAARREGR